MCGRGGIGRRATLRSLWPKGRGSSSLLDRTIQFDKVTNFRLRACWACEMAQFRRVWRRGFWERGSEMLSSHLLRLRSFQPDLEFISATLLPILLHRTMVAAERQLPAPAARKVAVSKRPSQNAGVEKAAGPQLGPEIWRPNGYKGSNSANYASASASITASRSPLTTM